MQFSLKTGFDSLTSRTIENELITKLEIEYSFELPIEFRKFISSYGFISNASEEVIIKEEKKKFIRNDFFIKDLINVKDYAAIAKQADNFVMIGGINFKRFIPIELIFEYSKSDDFLIEESLLMIGSWGSSDSTIMVGYGEDNYDQIFVDSSGFSGKPIRKIGDSILNIVPYFKQYCFLPEIVCDNLYKNDDETFWRM